VLSEADVFAARWSARAAALERALDYARRAGDKRDEATLISMLSQALAFGPTPVQEAIRRCTELRESAPDDPAVEAAIASTVAGLRAMEGEFDEARELCRRSDELYDELGLRLMRAARSLPAAWVELLAGDPEAAVRELRWAYDEVVQMGERSLRPTLAAYLAYALAEAGRFDEAEELSIVSDELGLPADVVTQAVWRCARARALAHRGESDEADRLARRAVELAGSTDFLELQGQTLMTLGEVLRLGGRAQAAALLIDSARETYERKGNIVAARRASAVLGEALA
jgi:tetratricopeptide (TPR) repeat protein